MHIRPSTHEDAGKAAELLRRSIAELCGDDHGGDPAILQAWLENKTPEAFAAWVEEPQNLLLCAVADDGRLLGVGALRRPDQVMLNYVHPEARFCGVGRALMAALETAARELGAERTRLSSTRTAHAFYRAGGYHDVGESSTHGMTAFDMEKELRP